MLTIRGFGLVQKNPPSKAATAFARGVYMQDVSTQNWRPALREAVPAKAGNLAGGFFQKTMGGSPLLQLEEEMRFTMHSISQSPSIKKPVRTSPPRVYGLLVLFQPSIVFDNHD